jgi:peptide/nickel transport system permease protein
MTAGRPWRRGASATAVGAVLALALLGPWLAPGSPTAPVGGPFAAADAGLPLGTDLLGRDVLARVLDGGRALVLQAVAATLLGSAVGLTVGTWAGVAVHTRAARIAVRAVDALAALPALLLLLVLGAGVPGSDAAVAVGIAIVSIPFSVRVIREAAAHLAATDYARDAHSRGESWAARLRYDVLPGLAPVALAEAGIRFVAATQLAATAGFLGLGGGAPAANWGRMVQENSAGIASNPLPVLVPAGLLVVLAVGVAVLLDRSAVGQGAGVAGRSGGIA